MHARLATVADDAAEHAVTAATLEELPEQTLIFAPQFGWTEVRGVRLSVLCDRLAPDAAFVTVHAADGYSTTLSREAAVRAVLIHRVGGAALPQRRGGPVRLVIEGGQSRINLKHVIAVSFAASAPADVLPACHHDAA